MIIFTTFAVKCRLDVAYLTGPEALALLEATAHGLAHTESMCWNQEHHAHTRLPVNHYPGPSGAPEEGLFSNLGLWKLIFSVPVSLNCHD